MREEKQMKKNLVRRASHLSKGWCFFGIVVMFLMFTVVVFADTKLPDAGLNFKSDLYIVNIWGEGSWAVKTRDSLISVSNPWPVNTEGSVWGPKAIIEEISGSSEEKDGETVMSYKGNTPGYIFEVIFNCKNKELKVTYNFEAKKKLQSCWPNLLSLGKWIADKEYEWGTTEGVPEGKGAIA
jgi:hypothetical protein